MPNANEAWDVPSRSRSSRIPPGTSARRRTNDAAKEEHCVSLEGLRVLLVDDAPDNQFLVAGLLTDNGAHVEPAEDGDERFNKAFEGSFDVVLLDIQMPMIDGYQVKQALDERGYA